MNRQIAVLTLLALGARSFTVIDKKSLLIEANIRKRGLKIKGKIPLSFLHSNMIPANELLKR
jgi:hypothetical protein